MTEQEWLASDDPEQMFASLNARGRSRKIRLFSCAFVRGHLELPPDAPAWLSVELAERWADGEATKDEVRAFRREHPANWTALTRSASEGARACVHTSSRGDGRARTADLLRCVFGNPHGRPATPRLPWVDDTVASLATAAYRQRPRPDGLLDGVRLSVLADALEDLGCRDDCVLGHLRGPASHVRGCWVLDLILGNQ